MIKSKSETYFIRTSGYNVTEHIEEHILDVA